MKTSILILISVFTISKALYAQCSFVEDYSNDSGWTQIGTDVIISNGQLEYQNGAADAEQRRVYKDLGVTLDSNDYWIAEFEFTPNAVGTYLGQPNTGHSLLAITAGTQEPFNDCPDIQCAGYPIGTQDGIIVVYGANGPPTGDLYFIIKTKDDSTEYTSSKMISNFLDTTYYLRLERTSSTEAKLSIFSDSARTVHIANSPISDTIPSSVMGLTTVQHANIARGNSTRELTGSIDNLCINFNQNTGVFNSELGENKLKLFPNPTSDVLHINITDAPLADILIHNSVGQLLIEKQFTGTANSLNISKLPKGVYFIRVKTGRQIFNHKIVKL